MEDVTFGATSYYAMLGVGSGSSMEEIRRAYRKLAMQWHPDRWSRISNYSLLTEAKAKFQEIQEAYSVLSDQGKRAMYDAGFYNHEDEDDEAFCDFVQEMVSLMSQVRNEDSKCHNMEELKTMFMDMAQGF